MRPLLALLAVLIAGFALGCEDSDNGGTPTSPSPAPFPAATVTLTQAAPSPTPFPNVCQANPDPATPDVQVIDAPASGSAVTSPVTVSGRIAAFEATFKVTIFDAAGSVIADLTGMSAEGQTLAAFSEDVTFSVSAPTAACIWVYEASAEDGSSIHVGQIPVLLQP